MCKISIIVPVYKAEKYIHRCINSILSQTFQDFEIILIDDGSPDKSGKICDEYAKKDNRIRVFHKENGGVTSARKFGIEKSNGEWIVLVDSDDYLESNTLQVLLSYGLKTKSELVIGHYKYVDENCNLIKIVENHIQGNYSINVLESLLRNQCAGSLWCRLIKKTLFNNIYYPPQNINMGEDIICGIQLISNADKITICPNVVYNYVQQTSSITHNMNSQTVKYMPEFIKWVHSYIINKYPELKIVSSSFCLQQYYTYLTHEGVFNKDLFKFMFDKRSLIYLNYKAKFLFSIYQYSPIIGNILIKTIHIKHLLRL